MDLLSLRTLKFVARYNHGKLNLIDFWARKPPILVFRHVEYVFIDWQAIRTSNHRQSVSKFVAISRSNFHPMKIQTQVNLRQFTLCGPYSILNSSTIIAVRHSKKIKTDYEFIRLTFTFSI